jgi:hypothetical protein
MDGADDASVRVAMTVVERVGKTSGHATRIDVDDKASILRTTHAIILNADLSVGVDVDSACRIPLIANRGLAMRGVQPQGEGFQLEAEEAAELLADAENAVVVRPHRNGRDLAARSRNRFIIDFALMEESQARAYARPFNLVIDRVKPDRQANKRESYARYWWRLGEPRPGLRSAIVALDRFIATPETAAHRFFVFLNSDHSVDNGVVVVASADPFLLGVLSSRIHADWSKASGTRLGVGNDERYNNPRCFDAFAFPSARSELRSGIVDIAERLDAHRKSAIARDDRVTMTGMYNVVAKLRSGEALTPKERTIHELAACGVLRDIHDELDGLVAEAYGWPWPMPDAEILERLVALHDERVAEEKRGIIRWLRPEYQAPGLAAAAPAAELELPDAVPAEAAVVVSAPEPWPAGAIEQIGALKRLVQGAALTAEQATARFSGARREIVERHLETLAILGEVRGAREGSYVAAGQAA